MNDGIPRITSDYSTQSLKDSPISLSNAKNRFPNSYIKYWFKGYKLNFFIISRITGKKDIVGEAKKQNLTVQQYIKTIENIKGTNINKRAVGNGNKKIGIVLNGMTIRELSIKYNVPYIKIYDRYKRNVCSEHTYDSLILGK